jgi:hypothetical protein
LGTSAAIGRILQQHQTRAQDTPSQCHLASFAIDRKVEVPLAKRHEAPFGPIRIKRSVRGIQWFLQHFEKRALGEITGAQNVSTQHHDAVFIGFRGSAELCEGSVDPLTHCWRQCMTAPSTMECCKTPEKPLFLPHLTQFL